MRIVVVDTYYPAFLDEHYAVDPGLAERPYEEQLASLIDACFGTSDAYSRYLGDLGHDVIDVIPNCLPLQRRWAKDYDRPGALRRLGTRAPSLVRRFTSASFCEETAIAQIEAHDAEIIYSQDVAFFSRASLERLRSQGRLVVGQTATEMRDEDRIRGFDLLLTSFPHYVERLREMGLDCEYLQIGFYDGVLDRLRREGVDPSVEAQRPHRLVFAGGISVAQHQVRIATLEGIANRLPLEFWGYGADQLPAGSALRRAHRGQAWGIDMYRMLAGSRLIINVHGEVAEGFANNMRLFEATGCGALLFTEAAPNLADFFEDGREVVSYDGADDLMDKLTYYLENDDERRAIAAAGQVRTLRDHGYEKVMAKLASVLEARLP